MKWLQILSIASLVLMMGCERKSEFSSKNLKQNEFIYWVNSSTQECMGVGSMTCLQIQKGSEIKEGDWSLFYNQIEGFEYEPGYIYKLIVLEEKLPDEKVPADASAIKYTLIQVLEKKRG